MKNKKSKYPEWYIGKPKPMKTKTFKFHKPTTKNYIQLAIILAIVAFLTYIVIRLVQVEKLIEPDFEYYAFDEEKSQDKYVLENEKLKFELNPFTTSFTILQKDTGHIWYSNPPKLDEDPLAMPKEKNKMKSPFLVGYSTINGSDDVYELYSNSIQRQFYTVSQKANEIRVDYTIGQMEREYIFPLAIYEDELQKWQEGAPKSITNKVARAYSNFTLKSIKDEKTREEMLAKYPDLANQTLYLVFSNIQTYLKEDMEKIFSDFGYTYNDYLRHKEMYKENNVKEVPAFNLSVTYKLDKNNLIVDIPFDDISYKRKYPITSISVLPYFAAGGVEDEGFMFVPEGSGALINFNNGKTKQNNYYADVYGWDYATDRTAVITETKNTFPVFGVSFGDSSFISISEEGDEYAGYTAEIAGKLGSYNYVRADYKMLHREQFEVSSRNTSAQFSYEDGLPKGERITQIYSFVNGGSYVDMAKQYRQYLFEKEKKINEKNVPLAVEVVCAIDKVQQVLGIPKALPYTMTTFEQAGTIINEIEQMGINNTDVKISGAINGGIRQKILKNVKFINKIGGKSGFKKLQKSIENTSVKLYLDASVQTAHRSALKDGFFKYTDAVKFVSDEIAELSEYNPIWYGKDLTRSTYYLLKPKLIDNASEVLLKNAKKLGVNISYRDNGNLLSADYNEDDLVSRAEARNQQVNKMKKINDEGLSVMINGGNAYAIKNAEFITNMSLHGNNYAILDRLVPFYQIALHGYKKYAGIPVNLSYNNEQTILESAESGAGLYFVFAQSSEKRIQETKYTEYYAINFDTQKEQFEKIYNRYNKEMNPVVNSLISNHEYLSDDVTVTTFENGYKVYTNFGFLDFITDDGIKIPCRDYKVVR